MAIELELVSAVALITGDVREKKTYEGRGEARRETGRATDADGRPVSIANAVVITEPLGLLGDAQVQLPDVQLSQVEPGSVIKLDGRLGARLAGRDFGGIGATVSGERVIPVGNYVEWTVAAANGKKPAESRAS
ncbi:hypothetical protein GCM10022236_10320 [Microlunatus ginsengisoli]|uniref:Uncharacterized protein n=2 Tax=Microlunatus ginsengisoli TaxID=363863 RepID=A0ABP6ZJ38_9ACTN